MNIQIFGKSKCFETKKAERYFKERGIKFQSIDLPSKGLSPGEYRNIKAAVGAEPLADDQSKAYQTHFMAYLTPEAAEEKLLEHPELFRTPIVRNGRQATVGFHPEVWKTWE